MRARRSCATSDIAALLPPWLVTITSLRTPARATLSPIAIQSFSATSVGSVSVPGIIDMFGGNADRLQRQKGDRKC